MPQGMPSRGDDIALRGQRLLETMEKQRALDQRMHPKPPAWSLGVPRPPQRTAHDLPRQWPVSVKRGETLALLARWSRSDKKELWSDNRETLPRRKYLRPGDRLQVTMSPNQKLVFDQSRERFHTRRLKRYFATRYIEKVVKYRVRRGDYISKVAARFGDVPTWLLEAFNQSDFKSIQPGDTVLIPVITKADQGERPTGVLQVVDERGRPLKTEEKARLQGQTRMDMINQARLAMDDSNVFERADEPARPVQQAVPTEFATRWAAAKPKGPVSEVETLSEAQPKPKASGKLSEEPGAVAAGRPVAVRPGETIGHFAAWSGLSVRHIERTNPGLQADRVRIGQRLELTLDDEAWVNFLLARAKKSKASRGTKFAAGAAKREEEQKIEKAKALQPLRPSGKPQPLPAVIRATKAAPSTAHEALTRVHIVQPGEIAGRIARKYGLTIKALIRANPATNLDRIRPGLKLKIPLTSS